MSSSQFGPFADVFGKHGLKIPGHLELLDLRGAGVDIVLDRIQVALSAQESQRWLQVLFDDPNWRPHLVGAVALLSSNPQPSDCLALWRAIDAGSWVTPQLVVAAYFVDGAFQERVMSRIESGCAIIVPPGLSPPERHSATGPGGTVHRSAKLLSSLMCMGRRIHALAPLIDEMSRAPGVVALLEQDIDYSAQIAESWCEQIVARCAARGRTLLRRFQ